MQAVDQRQWEYDPIAEPELFDTIRRRRVFAFGIDLMLIALVWCVAAAIVFVLGILSFGLAWQLYAALWPLVALGYVALTVGGPKAATPGMTMVGLTVRMWYGPRPDWLIAAMHAVAFYISMLATPLVLVVGLFSDRKRLLHDMLLGIVVLDRAALHHPREAGRIDLIAPA